MEDILFIKKNYYNQLNKYDIRLLKKLDKELDDLNKTNKNFKKIIGKLDLIDIFTDEDNIYDTLIQVNEKNDVINTIEEAINKKQKIKIVYENIYGIYKERIVTPYQIFKHKNRLYAVCYCEYKQDFRHFEINRIKIIK